jgi:septal ring factor EnvC (AmiA/AmiB activator)
MGGMNEGPGRREGNAAPERLERLSGRMATALLFALGLLASSPRAIAQGEAVSTAPPPAGSEEGAPDPAEVRRLRQEVDRLRLRLDERKGSVDDAAEEARRLDRLVELLTKERLLAEAEWRSASAEKVALGVEIESAGKAREEVLRRLGSHLATLYRLGEGGVLRLLIAPGSPDRLAAARQLALFVRRDLRITRELEEGERLAGAKREEIGRLEESVLRLARARAVKEEELREARVRQNLVASELRRVQERDSRKLADLQERAGRLERILELLSKSRLSRELSGEDPRRFRGALGWPHSGPVVTFFGRQKHPRFLAFVMNNGIEIGASPGAPVVAVFPGRVLYARFLKGYGNTVIVDHGSKFLTIYAKLGSVSTMEGRDVRIDESVGTVGAPAEDEGAVVYFEIRDGGKAVDPIPWLRPATPGRAKG